MPASIPPPTDSDHEDVHWALTTANSLHAQGEQAEALRWLRKAVSAAVACDDSRRAAELGRSATALESSLTGANTMRGADDGETAPLGHNFDLDSPTHVDSPDRHLDAAISSTDNDITLVPFTKKAREAPSSATALSRVSADAPRKQRAVADTLQTDHFRIDHAPTVVDDGELPPYIEPGTESTVAMRAVPNAHEISDVDSMTSDDSPMSQTAQAITAVPQHRVALLASPDGYDPRVMLLRNNMRAPPGAGVAILTPASSRDAALIAHLLGLPQK